MKEHWLRVVPPPAGSERRFARCMPQPQLHGEAGEHVYLCGNCGMMVTRGVLPEDLAGWTAACDNCGAWNVYDPAGQQADGDPVVVVEDERELLQVISESLKDEGIPVVGLSSSEGMHTIGRDVQPQLFLLDIMLPGKNGIELARELRGSGYEETPIVAMSASSSMLRAASDSHLFTETLPKPFDLSRLIDTVERYVQTPN